MRRSKKIKTGGGSVDVEALLYVHRNSRLIRDGSPGSHLDFHTAPEFCPVLARIIRDIYISILTNRAQLSHATNLPILTANRRVGEGKRKGGGGSSLLPSPQSGTTTPLCWGGPQPGGGRKPEILTRLSLPSRINQCRLQNSQLKYSRPEDTGKLRKERNSTKMHKATKLQQHLGRMKWINDKKRRFNLKTNNKKRLAKMAVLHTNNTECAWKCAKRHLVTWSRWREQCFVSWRDTWPKYCGATKPGETFSTRNT